MAEKKTAKTENKAVKPIVLTDNVTGDVYVLEFSRDSVKFAESKGFDINEFGSKVQISAIEDLFWYAFRMHQPKTSKADADKILYEKLGGVPEGLVERLAELYLAPFNSLIRDEESSKNSQMTVDF